MRLSGIVAGDHVKWSWEVTCCHFILSLHSAGGGRGPWKTVVITCKTCLLQSMIRTIIFGWLMLVIRMYLWKPSECSMLTSVVWTFLRRFRYERRVTCIRMRVIRMVMRATCHYEVRDTCSQEEGSLRILLKNVLSAVCHWHFLIKEFLKGKACCVADFSYKVMMHKLVCLLNLLFTRQLELLRLKKKKKSLSRLSKQCTKQGLTSPTY